MFSATCCYSGFAFAQERLNVSGLVTDSIDNQPLQGVTVQVENTTVSAQTDMNEDTTLKCFQIQFYPSRLWGIERSGYM